MKEEEYAKIVSRVHAYPLPPEDFDPLKAPNHKLSEYGLLERPDEHIEPDRFAFWKELFGGKFVVVQPSLSKALTLELRAKFVSRPGPRPGLRRGFDHLENSFNWSGAYVTPLPRPNRMVHVVGAWTVPRPSVPMDLPEGADPTNQEYHASTWVGIGGHRSYNTLPQIGTTQSVKIVNGVAAVSYSAWWQWWNRDDLASHYPQDIPIADGFEVREGDRILASVRLAAPSPGDVHFIIMNLRTGLLVPFLVRAPADILPLGSTAEWIHERPSRPGSRYRYPLPNSTDVTFSACLAWSAPDTGAPSVLQKLEHNVRLIRMRELFGGPHRSALVSKPRIVNPTTLKIS